MKILALIISFQLIGLSFGLSCYHCPFDDEDPEKPCALDPKQAEEQPCRRANACITETGVYESDSGSKNVQYRQCGKMAKKEELDDDNCQDAIRDTFTVKKCYCTGDLCNKPDEPSSTPIWVWIVVVVVLVLIIGAIAGFFIWKRNRD